VNHDGVLLFSGGLDSLCLGILLRRDGLDLIPVYVHHRANGGGITSKEVKAATKLAPLVTGHELAHVRKRPRGTPKQVVGDPDTRTFWTTKVPLTTKVKKNRRNEELIRALVDCGLGHGVVALGALGHDEEARWVDLSGYPFQRDIEHYHLQGKFPRGPELITPQSMGLGKADLIASVGPWHADEMFASDSCLMYFKRHCGNCKSCKSRAQAFLVALGEDRTNYRRDSWADRLRKANRKR